ncbi:MFS transporter [Paraburkholderia megapolitana]|uniref:MFS transporter n=1 Tax=Paraburkholderia megapolitana TaxID=420953 RepID=UPI0038BB36B1
MDQHFTRHASKGDVDTNLNPAIAGRSALLACLDQQTRLTGNQWRVITAAILGDMLEFFDYFVVGFVLAFVVGPWHLSFGQSALILLSSGVGAMGGAIVYGRIADRFGRRKVFLATVVNFSLASGALAFTPDHGWVYLAVFRFIVGFGVGGLYCVDLPLTQEFVPASKRGLVGGLVTAAVPVGMLLGSVIAAFLSHWIGWRGLFGVGLAPALLTLLIRMWVPESPHWLLSVGRVDEARRSIAWALEVDPWTLPAAPEPIRRMQAGVRDLFSYPRRVALTWMINLTAQTGYYGFLMWAPTLFVLQLGVSPARASFLMIFVTLAGFSGRIFFSILADRIGRRACGAMAGLGGAFLLTAAAFGHATTIGTLSAFVSGLILANVFVDGAFAVVGPYSSEIWPSSLRATGMGWAYGVGGLGKIIGPLGLALIVGSSNVINPAASLASLIPAFGFLATCYLVAGLSFLLFGIETRGAALETIGE